jgi:type I restriction enzyme S subunit
MHTLNAPQTRSAIEAHARGTTRLRVSRRNLETLWLPVPPVSEQKRIVVKVEELLAHVNAARERLEHVPAVLKRFRQSVLAAACSGRLTAEWRETGTSTSNGMELMQQIDRERQGSRSLSRSRRHDAEGDDSAAAARSWEVPDTWEWARINDLLHYERNAAYGVLQPGIDSPDGVPFVRVCDLVNGTVDTRCLKRIDPDIDKRYPRTRLHGGEVLVTLVGTIGRIAVVPEELAGANVARAIGMLPLCPHVLPQFLRLALENPAKNMELVDLAREVARKTLNLGLLKDVTVPLPPLEEQHEIVRRVDALWRSASGASLGVRAATERASALSRAILAKAFRGELVPTEAELARAEGRDYESAEALLERIGNGRSRPEQRTPPRRARRPGS